MVPVKLPDAIRIVDIESYLFIFGKMHIIKNIMFFFFVVGPIGTANRVCNVASQKIVVGYIKTFFCFFSQLYICNNLFKR